MERLLAHPGLMADQFSAEIAWASDFRMTVIVLRGADPRGATWRSLLHRLRRTPRPVILHVLGDGLLGVQARGELADAIGHRARVCVIAESERGRSLGAALRWLGVDAQGYGAQQLQQATASLGLDTARVRSAIDALSHTGIGLPVLPPVRAVDSWR